MSRREAWLTAVVIFAVAVAVRVLAASVIVFPKPEDTAYYVGVARNIVEGRGLVSDALWSYATPPLVFPRPAFEVWLPLPTFLYAVPMAFLGTGADVAGAHAVAQVASVVIGALVPVLAWRLAADVAAERTMPVGRARSFAIGTGIASAFYLPLVLHSALPDSTMPFAGLALGACVLMTRALADPRDARATDLRLIGIGILVGLAALTRNEAIWLAATWVLLVLVVPRARLGDHPWATRFRLVAVVAVVSLIVFAPWAVRDWQTFGSPLPGQAVSNAFSVTGFDIFAWKDPPTLGRYLALGLGRLISLRVDGIVHNLVNVLLYLGVPVSVIGLLALPWQGRDRALRPVLLLSVITFLVTSLVFPVATTWGTFLHAAGPAHVLLLISALGALDALIVRVGQMRGWTRPVAWLGPALAIFASAVFTAVLLPSFGGSSAYTERQYDALRTSLAQAGHPLDGGSPVIHDFPIWLAETERVPSLALPAESPTDVLDLANHFGAKLLVIAKDDHGGWPGRLDMKTDPATHCFEEVTLPRPAGVDPDAPEALKGWRAFTIGCPTTTTASGSRQTGQVGTDNGS